MTAIDTSLVDRLDETWRTPAGLRGSMRTVDHKIIGKRYLVTALVFLLLGGLEALVLRAQLAVPDARLIGADLYNQLFTMHGVTMIFFFAAPVLSGFGNYLWPLVLGARDMAFPRLNALSYWVYLAAGLLLYASVPIGAMPRAGWFNYVPLADATWSPGLSTDFYALSLLLLGVSTTAGAINFIVTLFKLRAPGMSLNRMPILVWGTLSASFANLFAIPALSAACAMLFLDRRFGTHFFDVSAGGSTLLWQHLFWMFGHPWVYIIVLPAISMATEALTTFCRRPLIGYRFLALSAVATTILGFGVWVHHMFGTGVSPLVMTFFGASSMAIAIPTGISVFAWLVTIWFGRPIITTSFLYIAGFIVLLVIGGVSGVMTASVPFDWQLTDTYFVVAHLHYVLLGINVFPAIAALFYWFPKITGRLLDERLGRASFWTLFVGTNVVFFPMHIVGMLGMPRRVWTYPDGLGWGGWNMLETIGAFMVGAGVLLVIWNVAASLVRGERAGANPWGAPTLEWATPSPAPPYNFAVIPTVASRYPLWEDTGDGKGSKIHEGPALSEGHQVLETTPLDARRARVLHMPGDSWSPLIVSAAAMLCCCGLLVGNTVLSAAGGLGVAAGLVVWLWPGLEVAAAPANRAEAGSEREPRSLAWWGMAGLIATEAALFAFLLFSYFYLGSVQQAAWPPRGLPGLTLPLVSTCLLVASSVVLSWGHRAMGKGSRIRLGAGLGGTLLLGFAFLALQAVEYAHRTAGPGTDAYTSIFYVLTGFHGLHVLVGLVMLATLLARELRGGPGRGHNTSLTAASLYWHFVDVVWLAVFATLYLTPRL